MMMLAAACGGDDVAPTLTRAPTVTSEITPTALPTNTVAPTDTPVPAETGTSDTKEVVFEIASAGEKLEFDKVSLTATAGVEVLLKFTNTSGAQQHNWVLVQAGTKDDVATAGTLAGPGDGWIPLGDERIIAHTDLLDGGTSADVSFTAPVAGTYQFVCTFPGHNPTMFGDFVVTP